ncbi:DUF4337 domain-containing protein [uncultured Sphingomonas sp.]|uniref:DUF4337 domain-containing protein n=1 Tax=uncultured Sphingomonas sp. TaxID=158754 RepID=UPI0035CBAB9A
MEVEVSAEAKDKRLNRLVAITVVILSVFTGVCNIKDGNIVQAMAQAKADSVDRWAEYQATKTKQHIAETARGEIATLAGPTNGAAAAATRALDVDIARYRAKAPGLAGEAQGFADRYDALNVHDDQFDASEALVSTAISMAAVSALVESFWLLIAAWAFGAMGLFMGICGFAGFAFHPDVLSSFLG